MKTMEHVNAEPPTGDEFDLSEKSKSTFPFDNLRPLSYGLIMADPPWHFATRSPRGEKKSPQAHYKCMTLNDIRTLPVRQLAAPDCLLWLWATHPMLPHAIATLEAWGFKYVTSGAWIKRTRNGKLGFGTGYVLRSASEPFLIGSVGKPKTANNVRSAFDGLLRQHSRKPDEAYQIAEQLAVGATRRVDLFARERRPRWDAWGDEINRFNQSVVTSC
jgi:N6-adenosine-specific RNA methylase IME4